MFFEPHSGHVCSFSSSAFLSALRFRCLRFRGEITRASLSGVGWGAVVSVHFSRQIATVQSYSSQFNRVSLPFGVFGGTYVWYGESACRLAECFVLVKQPIEKSYAYI